MSLGVFENHGDLGKIALAGAGAFEAATGRYTVSGSGANMWGTNDAFHFVSSQASGDFSLSATIAFVGEGVDAHRKAGLMLRQSLDADAAYVDAVVHGDGLTSLQFRETKGGPTREVQVDVIAPPRLTLEKRGKFVRLFLGEAFSGAAALAEFSEPFFIGLAVCAHNADVLETAVFSDVALALPLPPPIQTPTLYSTLETQSIASTDRRVRLCLPAHFEAPNWLPDNSALLYNSGGRIYWFPLDGGAPAPIDTGFAVRCNNDHGVTFDGQTLILSDQSQGDGQSRIYTLPLSGGTPTLVTPLGPSYWHGVSPDGTTLAYCARRDGDYDIYTIPIGGGEETRLTAAPGLDDGPEYSPDGLFIYFNSERTGKMHIWRMRLDGSEQEQITFDELNNWFPHVSPDGRFMAFLSYESDVTGHPADKEIQLRLMELATGKITVLARLFGGQGTINVASWSPDSRQIAFVSYQRIG